VTKNSNFFRKTLDKNKEILYIGFTLRGNIKQKEDFMAWYIFGEDVEDMELTEINKLFRKNDDSHLWPINGRFNATERAIRRIQKKRREGLVIDDGLEYAEALKQEISNIVNDPKLA
jgi:hypothetical protein